MKYFFRRTTSTQWECHKIGDAGDPEVIYRLTSRGGCDCPAGSYGRGCKHAEILKGWLSLGGNILTYYDSDSRVFETLDPFGSLLKFLDSYNIKFHRGEL